jgi:UPF0716 family protein affecting phage T7 exclusion
VIYALLYLFIEVVVSVNLFSILGGIGAFVEIIGTALLGAFFLANFRYTLAESLDALSKRNLTPEAFGQLNLFVFIGAILLILPGVFSDILGLALQFSTVATLVAKRFMPSNAPDHKRPKEDVIDVEVLEHDPEKLDEKRE